MFLWGSRVRVQEEDSQTGDPTRENASQIYFHFVQIQLPPHLQRIPRAAWGPQDTKPSHYAATDWGSAFALSNKPTV